MYERDVSMSSKESNLILTEKERVPVKNKFI